MPILIDAALTLHESLAICEYANELRPEAGLRPHDPIQHAPAIPHYDALAQSP